MFCLSILRFLVNNCATAGVFCLQWDMIYVIFKGNNGGVIRQKGISPFGVVFFRLKAVVT